MVVRLTVLVDNEPGEGLRNAWGLSVLVETPDWTALFDADTDPAVLEFNVRKLSASLDKLDFAVLSHHHYDHTGGFVYVAKIKPRLQVYVPPGPADRLSDMGLNPMVVQKTTRVAPGAYVVGPLRAGVWGGLYEEAFAFELPNGEIFVLVGCAHPGADRLVERAKQDVGAKIHGVLGGYHSPPPSVIDRLALLADKVCPAHCSGDAAKTYAKTRYPDRYCEVRTGLKLEFGLS